MLKLFHIDRTVAVLRPKQPLVDWLNALPDADRPYTTEDFYTDCTVLLLPDIDNDLQALKFIKKIYKEIFERELDSFCTDPVYWPTNRDFKTFIKFYEVEFHSEVTDTVDKEIIKEQWE